MQNTDRIIKMLAYEGRVNIICCSSTNLVEEARKTHDLSPVVTAAFGRLLTMTAMMGAEMKSSHHRLTIQLKGNGPIGTMVTVSNNTPRVKGFVSNPIVDIPLNEDGKLDVGEAVGHQGYLNIIKDIGLKDPYIGMVPIVSGEIAEDFANYFVTSEQSQAAVALGVLVDKNGVRSSGGYIIRAMPDATEEDITKLEQNIMKAGAISKMLDQKLSLLEIAKKVIGDEKLEVIEENIFPKYECDCSKEHMAEGLATIGKEELTKLIEEDSQAETVCHFCNKKYIFKKEELEEIINTINQ